MREVRAPFGGRFRIGDHVCWSYWSDEEQEAGVLAFLREGLELGQKVAYYGPAEAVARIAARTEEAGLRPALPGQLRFGDIEDAYLPGGSFDPEPRLRAYAAAVRTAWQQGFQGLRVLGDPASLLSHPEVGERWAEYELRADVLAAQLGFTALCAYDLRVCAPEQLSLLFAVHTHRSPGEPPAAWKRVLFRLRADARCLALKGQDLSCAGQLEALLRPALRDLAEPRLDVRRLRFIDLAGMRALASASRGLARGARLEVTGASPSFLKAWDLAAFDAPVSVQVER